MYRKIYEMLEQQGMVKTATILNGPHTGKKYIEDYKNEKTVCEDFWKPYLSEIRNCQETKFFECSGIRIFVEIYRKNPHLIILGGGHVSCPVAHLGKMLGFHVTVMDDREEFVSKDRFPDADVRIASGFERISELVPPYENAYYVVVTRNHAGDALCARQILNRPYTYFGMIGSRTKAALTRKTLLQEGFSKEELDTVHSPIGLPIGGSTPEEIAVSILGEIIQIKNSRGQGESDEKVEGAIQEGRHGTMLTIIKKTGSSPRGTGTKMFLDESGEIYGSIGGGSVEFQALQHAKNIKNTETAVYNLSLKESNDMYSLGMICGGSVEVLFEKV